MVGARLAKLISDQRRMSENEVQENVRMVSQFLIK